MPNYRSVICKKCGELKLPVFGCQNEKCSVYGAYRKRQPKLQSTQKIVIANKMKARDERLAYLKSYNANFAKRSKTQRHIHFRMVQIALRQLLSVFERDSAGNWQLYEDRLPEFQVFVKNAHKLHGESIKWFPVPKTIENDYKSLVNSISPGRRKFKQRKLKVLS